MAHTVYIYTDGACQGNPGPGGWGALLRWNGHQKTLSGSEPHTTNNRMELQAVIEALNSLNRSCRVVLITDSQYVRQGITRWLPNWKQRGWKTASRRPVKNQNLWQKLDTIACQHHIDWRWVKAHSGHVENELVDTLARKAIKQINHDD